MSLCDTVVSLIISEYEKLDKKGKPEKGKEWTMLSAFVVESDQNFRLVSMATGTKCLGKLAVCPQGTTVNDSHAEILARRGLIKYLMEEIALIKNNKNSIVFCNENEKLRLKNDFKLHFFTSQVPCGDASIIEMTPDEIEKVGGKRKMKINEVDSKKIKLDVHRTGAKPVKHGMTQDPKKDGIEYHKKGAVRTKPGRGDPTDSLSCSDKIARWIYTGVQGALISNLIDNQIKIDTITIGGGSPFDEEEIKRSLIERSKCPTAPKIYQTKIVFQDSEYSTNAAKPSPKSLIWVNGKVEVGVEGRKLGATKKNWNKCCLSVSRKDIFKQFIQLDNKFALKTYIEAKKSAVKYHKLSDEFKNKMEAWSVDKSHFQQFKLNI